MSNTFVSDSQFNWFSVSLFIFSVLAVFFVFVLRAWYRRNIRVKGEKEFTAKNNTIGASMFIFGFLAAAAGVIAVIGLFGGPPVSSDLYKEHYPGAAGSTNRDHTFVTPDGKVCGYDIDVRTENIVFNRTVLTVNCSK